jgi:hypothetical protein
LPVFLVGLDVEAAMLRLRGRRQKKLMGRDWQFARALLKPLVLSRYHAVTSGWFNGLRRAPRFRAFVLEACSGQQLPSAGKSWHLTRTLAARMTCEGV